MSSILNLGLIFGYEWFFCKYLRTQFFFKTSFSSHQNLPGTEVTKIQPTTLVDKVVSTLKKETFQNYLRQILVKHRNTISLG